MVVGDFARGRQRQIAVAGGTRTRSARRGRAAATAAAAPIVTTVAEGRAFAERTLGLEFVTRLIRAVPRPDKSTPCTPMRPNVVNASTCA